MVQDDLKNMIHSSIRFLSDVGLITEQEYQSVSSHANLCHIRFNHMYRFNMIGMEGRNKGGLMNLVSEGYPTLSLIALSINNLRFVPPQSNQHFIGVLNEPSVMGVVKGYDSQSQHPYWLVDVSIIPCEPIQLRLPMTSSETNANYGGIAGYAFGIEPLHSSVCSQSLSTIPIIPLFSFIHISIQTEMMIHTDSNEREKNSIETSQRVPHTGTNSTRNDLAS